MEIFYVSLFGNREINDIIEMENRLSPVIEGLIEAKSYVSFLIGRNGEFDEFAASVIKRIRKKKGRENNDLTLVLPYAVTNLEYYEKYYDDVIIPDAMKGLHHKSAITFRNRWMIEHSELVIVYTNRDKGGAYAAQKYAEKLNKKTLKLFSQEGIQA